MQEQERDRRLDYWFKRIKTDSQRLTDQHRLSLVKAILINHCQLTPEELSVFLNPAFTPTAEKLDETFIYTNAEKKIANYYNSSFPQEGTQAYEECKQRHDAFKNDFKQALTTGFYEEDQIDEILSFMPTSEADAFTVAWLVSGNFYAMRRIRNAYIPGMVTSEIWVVNEKGRVLETKDVTHTLFDNGEDAVSQLERLVGDDPKET